MAARVHHTEDRVRMRLAGGFTLIEVLVAVFVLAVGVVGAAAVHTLTLRTRHQSALMSRALHLGSALADSMRANPAQMRRADAANPYLQLRYDGLRDGAPPLVRPCHHTAACDTGELADADIGQLRQAVHAGFPGGRVLVCRDQQVWDPARQSLVWECAGAASAPIVIKLGWRAAGEAFSPSVAIVVAGVPG